MLRREVQKLSLLDSRVEIYTTVSSHITQVPFNEQRLPADHTSNNDLKAIRAIVTFRQAKMLINAVSLRNIADKGKLLIDLQQITPGTPATTAT